VRAIYILWLRELKRYTRSRAQIVASLGQPLLYLLALGFGLGPVFQQAGRGSYLQFVAPGVIGMSVLFSSIFSGIGLLWDRQFGLLVLVICLIAGFRPAGVAALPLAFLFIALICVVFAALGMAIGSTLQNMQGFQLIMNFLVMPIFFLSGALFPLSNLPTALTVITRIDPLTYGIDGLRGALIGTGHFSVGVDLAVLASVAIAFLALGAHRFSRIQI
jgi:ABC-2 type transport system permease protein